MARHKAIRQSSNCIYCGHALGPGSITVDHVPSRAVFDFRDRPKGFEFPSCRRCNNGARVTDLVVALLSRMYPDGPTEQHRDEMKRLMNSVSRRAPGVLPELMPYPAMEKTAKKHTGGRHVLRLNGPTVRGHLERFAARVGFAIHYHATKCILPATGGVIAQMFTNYDVLKGDFPSDLVAEMGEPMTLRAGSKNVSDQFALQFKYTEDGAATVGFFTLRQSFSFFTFSADDPSRLDFEGKATLYRPGFLRQEINPGFPAIQFRTRL